MMETCILCGMRAMLRPHVASADGSCADNKPEACLCYWRSYVAGKDAYCLHRAFYTSLNLNLVSGGSLTVAV